MKRVKHRVSVLFSPEHRTVRNTAVQLRHRLDQARRKVPYETHKTERASPPPHRRAPQRGFFPAFFISALEGIPKLGTMGDDVQVE
jgi:hypothetical protein